MKKRAGYENISDVIARAEAQVAPAPVEDSEEVKGLKRQKAGLDAALSQSHQLISRLETTIRVLTKMVP